MGSHHTAVIVEPGCYVYTFGQNSEGQLGMGNTKSTTGPVKVQHLINEKVVVSIQIYNVYIKHKFLTTDNPFSWSINAQSTDCLNLIKQLLHTDILGLLVIVTAFQLLYLLTFTVGNLLEFP